MQTSFLFALVPSCHCTLKCQGRKHNFIFVMKPVISGKKIKSGCLLCNPKGKALLSYKTVSVKAEFLISGSAMGKMPNLALKTFQKQNQSSSAGFPEAMWMNTVS